MDARGPVERLSFEVRRLDARIAELEGRLARLEEGDRVATTPPPVPAPDPAESPFGPTITYPDPVRHKAALTRALEMFGLVPEAAPAAAPAAPPSADAARHRKALE
ncbi:MAG: hypothetical protein ACREID_04500, partial [Planctomycetota bacterium]